MRAWSRTVDEERDPLYESSSFPASPTSSVRLWRHPLLQGLLLTAGVMVACLAVIGFRVERRFVNPVAYAFQDGELYVVEKAQNTVLRLGRFSPGEPMVARGVYRIEEDDEHYYYMVRKLYEGAEGLVVQSYIYEKESQEFVGYRFSSYPSLDRSPHLIFKIILANPKDYPEVTYAFDRQGNHYFTNNCAGRRNIWKIDAEGGVTMDRNTVAPGIRELGELNRVLSNWEGIAVDDSGRILVSSGATGRVLEYSPEGEKTGEIGTVGFDSGQLLAPDEVFFLAGVEGEPSRLTVTSKGNRSWVQFDEAGNVVRSIEPLAMGYPHRDVLVGPIYGNREEGGEFAFDLANKNLIILHPKIGTSTAYVTTRPVWTLGLLGLCAGILTAALMIRRIEAMAARVRLPFFFKLLALFLPLLAGSALVVGDTVRDIMKQDSEAESVRRSANLAQAVVKSLSAIDLRRIQWPEDREGMVYERIYQTIARLVDGRSVEQTPKWILHKIHQGKFYFGINIWRGAIFQPFIVTADRQIFHQVVQDKSCRSGRFADDQGEWFSYLCPVLDEAGAVSYILELYRPAEQLDRAERQAIRETAKVVGGTVLVAALLMLLFSYLFTRPLRRLIQGTDAVSRGDFGHRIPVRTRDELGDLARAFDRMVVDLEQYTAELARTTAEKESIQRELQLARQMQLEILPTRFPPFAGAEQVEIHAQTEPAREVGGDYYDFFLVDESHMAVLVADVAGKGVPAGLFMMRTRAVLRSFAMGNSSAADVLTRVNRQIAAENPSVTFVTLFYFICNLKTGHLTYCNAGHNPPLRIRDGRVEVLGHGLIEGRGVPIGYLEEARYSDGRLELGRGELLVLYTDGVTEAMNTHAEMFGEHRLTALLEIAAHQRPKEICRRVLSRVFDHQTGHEQSDDITVLVFRFEGSGGRRPAPKQPGAAFTGAVGTKPG